MRAAGGRRAGGQALLYGAGRTATPRHSGNHAARRSCLCLRALYGTAGARLESTSWRNLRPSRSITLSLSFAGLFAHDLSPAVFAAGAVRAARTALRGPRCADRVTRRGPRDTSHRTHHFIGQSSRRRRQGVSQLRRRGGARRRSCTTPARKTFYAVPGSEDARQIAAHGLRLASSSRARTP